METQEKKFTGMKISGFLALFIGLVLCALFIFLITNKQTACVAIGLAGLAITAASIFYGLIMIEPNETRVMIFFGKYKGTLTDNGFFWVNPFFSTRRIPIRARNLDIEPVKVNEKSVTPS